MKNRAVITIITWHAGLFYPFYELIKKVYD